MVAEHGGKDTMKKSWTISEFASLTGGVVFGRDDAMPTRIVSDSRDVLPGDAFIALPGALQDGHYFLEDAVKRGAKVLIGSNESLLKHNLSNNTGVLVKDTEANILLAAQKYMKLVNPIVISVTGSVGKTTTRECIHNVLSTNFKTHRPFRSYNTNIGCALTILSMPSDTNVLILEMGANHENEIASMVSLFPPDVAIITEAAAAHLEGFKNAEAIVSSKCEIYKNDKTKILFYNSDRYNLHSRIINDSKNVIAYGVGMHNSCYRIVETEFFIQNNKPCLSFTLQTKKDKYIVKSSFLGVHNVYPISFAIILGEYFNLSKENILKAISETQPLDGRGVYIPLKYGVTLIDDAYNANPVSMKAALDTLNSIESKGKKIAILGEMKELGSYSALYHTEILDAAKFCDFIILYGDIWQKEPIDLKDSELYNKIIISKSLEDCYYKIVEYIKNENIILIKGSHGNRLDIIVSKIIKEFMK